MSLPPNFASTLAGYDNEQLLDMLASKDDYLPEAIEPAHGELHSRHLAPEEEKQIQQNLKAKIAAQQRLQNLPLDGLLKALLHPLGLS